MSKRCPDCGFINEDARIYCGSCGELLDPELRLIKNLDAQTSSARKAASKTIPEEKPPAPAKKPVDDDDYVPQKTVREKKSSPLPWIILGIAVVAVVVALFVLS